VAIMANKVDGSPYSCVCNPKEIWQMVDELLVAEEQWLPQYKAAIEQVKQRLENGEFIATKGATRLEVKSVGKIA
jgi:alpha-galactosidase